VLFYARPSANSDLRNSVANALVELNLVVASETPRLGDFRNGFASMLSPLPNAIYFKVGNPVAHDTIQDSLVLTNGCPIPDSNTYIVVDDPQSCFYRLMNRLLREDTSLEEIEAFASDVREEHPGCKIHSSAKLGKVQLGEGCFIGPLSMIHSGTIIGDNASVGALVSIGAEGLAWAWNGADGTIVRQPQIGETRIGAGVFIGDRVVICRGSTSDTTHVGADSMIAPGTCIGHGVWIGAQVHVANNVSIAGNVRVDDSCFIGSGSVVEPGIRLPRGTLVGAGSVVSRAPDQTGLILKGNPARVVGERNAAAKGGAPWAPSRHFDDS